MRQLLWQQNRIILSGDGAAPNEIADMLVNSGIHAHALMDGNDWSAEQLFCYLLI
jgi:hypothetical protein